MKKFLPAILALVLTTPALPQDRAVVETEAKLRNIKVSLDLKNATLDSVVDYVRELGSFNILIDKTARDKGEVLISLTVRDLSLRSALNLMLKPHGLATMYKEGVLLIVSSEVSNEQVFLEIYDVKDLLYPIQDMPGVDISLSGLGILIGPDAPGGVTEFPLVEIVKAHTGGKTWDSNPKANVQLENGLLVVRQTREVHRQIRRLLGKLRDMK